MDAWKDLPSHVVAIGGRDQVLELMRCVSGESEGETLSDADLLEVWLKRVPRPAFVPGQRRVVVEVIFRAASVDHEVCVSPRVSITLALDVKRKRKLTDAGAAAEHTTPRVGYGASVEPRLGDSRVVPVERRVGLQLRCEERDLQIELARIAVVRHMCEYTSRSGAIRRIDVLRTGLDEKDVRVRILRQSAREHAAARACADDDVVIRLVLWER